MIWPGLNGEGRNAGSKFKGRVSAYCVCVDMIAVHRLSDMRLGFGQLVPRPGRALCKYDWKGAGFVAC
jgi:hypothetical protein